MWSLAVTFRESYLYFVSFVFLLVFSFYSFTFSSTLFLLYIAIHGLLEWFLRVYTVRLRLPPGPFPLPFVGNLIEIWPNRSDRETLREISDVYGPIFTVFLPGPVVVVCEQTKMNRLVTDRRRVRASPEDGPKLLRAPFALSLHERRRRIHVDKWTCQNPTFTRFMKNGRGPQCRRLQRQADVLIDDICYLMRKTRQETIDFDLAKHMKKAAISMVVDLVLGRDLRFDKSVLFARLEYCGYLKDEELLVELATSDNLFTQCSSPQRVAAENYVKSRELLGEEIKKDIEKVRLNVKNENPAESFVEKYAMLNFEPEAGCEGQMYRFAEGQSDTLNAICLDVLEQTIRPLAAIIDNSMKWYQANAHVQARLYDELIDNRGKPTRDYYDRDLLRRFTHEFMRQFSEDEWHNVTVVEEEELFFDGFVFPVGTTVVNCCPKKAPNMGLEVNNAPLPVYRCMCDAIVWRVLAHLYTNLVDNFIVTDCTDAMNPESSIPLCTVQYRPKKEVRVRMLSDDPTPWEVGSIAVGEKVRVSRQPMIFGEPLPMASLRPPIGGRRSPSPNRVERTKSSVSALFNFIKRNNQGDSSNKDKSKEKKSFLSAFLGRPRAFTQTAKKINQPTIQEEPKPEVETTPTSRSRAVTVSSMIKPQNTLNAVRNIFGGGGKKKDKRQKRRRKRRPSLPLPASIPEDSKQKLLPPVLRIEYTA
ncbi:hypothetical protein QR680_019062 [Steinernema hermaphroditum]|uniref:Cytochrome P450 n=1 Tax=Steinernema hermaphroditum TaxID=289476 RepID=A0AA39HL54_9BILA|nr:hypothetical protein QR680_019062 [Steinernema hermaphroditum]